MSRYRILVAWAWISVWMGVSVSSQPSKEMGGAHPTVRKLLESEHRNEAFAEITSWQRNLPLAAPYPSQDREVVDVLVCPQHEEPPLYAVLTNAESPRKRITLLDGDGTIIPFYHNDKALHGKLQDVNGDGRVDIAGQLPIQTSIDGVVVSMNMFLVLPISRENRAALTVLYNAQLATRPSSPTWSWRLSEATTPGAVAIELGPQIPESGPMEAQATYTWSVERQRFVGPPGGYDMPFLLVRGDDSGEIERFARSVYERADRGPEEPMRVGLDVQEPRKIFTPAPKYTKKARKARVQGPVIVQVIIDRDGKVMDIKVLKGLSHGLTEEAVKAIRRWTFRPATFQGKPVPVFYTLTVNFRLE